MPNAFCHVELSTADVVGSKKFYKSLFSWKVEGLGKAFADYAMIDVGKGTGGGMMQAPTPGTPGAWLPYVEVDDVRKTIAKARKLGAQIRVDYMEIPGEMGAFGVFIDPMGAALGVWQPAPKPAPKKAARKAKKKK
jgi:predicted enzyme related to lactoylglutathione lyase